MFNCERCGSSFNPLRAAALGYCPRCQGRDGVAAPLSFKLFAAATATNEARPASVGAEELVEPAAADHRLGSFGDHV
jgi:uncharacterized OB-fold protein